MHTKEMFERRGHRESISGLKGAYVSLERRAISGLERDL